jgi:hypothetical protein
MFDDTWISVHTEMMATSSVSNRPMFSRTTGLSNSIIIHPPNGLSFGSFSSLSSFWMIRRLSWGTQLGKGEPGSPPFPIPGPPYGHNSLGEPRSPESVSDELKTLRLSAFPSLEVAVAIHPHAFKSFFCCEPRLRNTPGSKFEKSQTTRGGYGGILVGLWLGVREGATDSDGVLLGDADGEAENDGVSLGVVLGFLEGASLGESDGATDSEGVLLGDADGEAEYVGVSLGVILGWADGAPDSDGVSLGDADGAAEYVGVSLGVILGFLEGVSLG